MRRWVSDRRQQGRQPGRADVGQCHCGQSAKVVRGWLLTQEAGQFRHRAIGIRAQHLKRLDPGEGAMARLRQRVHETEVGDRRGKARGERSKSFTPRAGLVFDPAQECGQRIGTDGANRKVSFGLWRVVFDAFTTVDVVIVQPIGQGTTLIGGLRFAWQSEGDKRHHR